MTNKRVRCPTCNSLLEVQTPPFAQTIECPVCHEFNHFKLNGPPQPARVHSFPPTNNYYNEPPPKSYYPPTYSDAPPPPTYNHPGSPRPMYPDTPPQPSYYRPTSPSPTYTVAPVTHYRATSPRPHYAAEAPPAYARPRPSRPHYGDTDPHMPFSYNRPGVQRPHYGDDQTPGYHRPTPPPRPLYGDDESAYPRPMLSQRPFYEDDDSAYHRHRPSPRPLYGYDEPDYNRPGSPPRPLFRNDEPAYYRPTPTATATYAEQRPMLSYYRPAGTPPLSVVERPPAPTLPPVQHASAYGKKRAVLCGVSYFGSNNELKGSVNDVKSMKYFLTDTMGFPENCVLILTENEGPQGIPTRRNILMALKWLVKGVQSGDSLVFYYSGLGSEVYDTNHDEIDGFDEAICPVDFETQGKIIDDEINETIVRPLPYGAKLHAIVDASHSGTILDLPFICRMNRSGRYAWEDQSCGTYKGTRGGLAVSITACDDDESTEDTTAFTASSSGSLTYSFIKAVENQPGLTYGSLLTAIRSSVHQAKPAISAYADDSSQEPQLSASEKIDVNTRKFLL